MNKTQKHNVLIVGNPSIHPSTEAFLRKFLRILKDIGDDKFIICGDKPPEFENITWIKLVIEKLSIFSAQIIICWIILKKRLNYEIMIILPTAYFIPTIFSKLMGKKVIVFTAQKVNSPILKLFSKINHFLSDLIVIESENIIQEWKIEKYEPKIMCGGLYVDTAIFKNDINFSERINIIGYLGLLSKRKGIENFIEAIKIINENGDLNNLKILIGGIGPFQEKVEIFSEKCENVDYIGLISNEKLPNFYNNLKMFILPTYSEGLPNVILEAMSCGTPVLATPVGGIPDVIRNGETGFIMENNSPECIAKNIVRSLNHSNLEKIAKNARELIDEKFTYEKAVKRWNKILREVI